jgi:DNA repair exonuclease SbcCD ATPase subunit
MNKLDPADITEIARLIMGGVNGRLNGFDERLLSIEESFRVSSKELSDSREFLRLELSRVKSCIDQYELAAIEARKDANEAKIQIEKAEKRIDDTIDDCKSGESTRIEKIVHEYRPKLTGKQIAAVLTIVLSVAGFLGGYQFYSLNNLSNQIEKVETRLHNMEVKP